MDMTSSQCSLIRKKFNNRSTLNEIYFGNTHHIVNGLRSVEPLSDGKQQAELQRDLMSALARKNAASAKAE